MCQDIINEYGNLTNTTVGPNFLSLQQLYTGSEILHAALSYKKNKIGRHKHKKAFTIWEVN